MDSGGPQRVVTVSYIVAPQALSFLRPVARAREPRTLSFRSFLPLVLESALSLTTCFSGGDIY